MLTHYRRQCIWHHRIFHGYWHQRGLFTNKTVCIAHFGWKLLENIFRFSCGNFLENFFRNFLASVWIFIRKLDDSLDTVISIKAPITTAIKTITCTNEWIENIVQMREGLTIQMLNLRIIWNKLCYNKMIARIFRKYEKETEQKRFVNIHDIFLSLSPLHSLKEEWKKRPITHERIKKVWHRILCAQFLFHLFNVKSCVNTWNPLSLSGKWYSRDRKDWARAAYKKKRRRKVLCTNVCMCAYIYIW